MRVKTTAVICVLGIVGLIIVTVGGVRFCKPQSIMGSLEVKFAGVTNEAGHISVTVTNCSRWQIAYWPRIEVKESGLWPPYPDNVPWDDLAEPRKLAANASELILVLPPTNASAWRLWVDYCADTERNEKVERIQRFCEKIGLGSLGYRIQRDMGGYVLLPASKEPLNRQAD